jgi:hypothetical protein
MPKEVKKEVETDVEKEVEDRFKTFFVNKNLTITENSVSYTGMEMDKEIYLKNLAGTSFYNARLERVMAIITFAAGILLLYFYKQYGIIYIVIAALLFIIGGIVAFILSKDKLTIHSNASALAISYKLGMGEQVKDIQKALNDAIKYSKRK